MDWSGSGYVGVCRWGVVDGRVMCFLLIGVWVECWGVCVI